MRRAFVSYARVNRGQVDKLLGHLGTLGCTTWIDSSLRGGQQWWDEILHQIAECDVFVPIVSADALNSTACQREFDWAEALGKPVLPIAVEALPKALPRRFSVRQIIDYSNPATAEQAAVKLAGAVASLPAAPPLPSPLPAPPAAPLSYLTDLLDLVSGPVPLNHDQQRQVLNQLEPALRSVDPHERQGGLDILERFSGSANLYDDVDRRLTWLKANTESRGAAAATRPSRRGMKVGLAVLGVVIVGGAVAYLVWPGATPSENRTAPMTSGQAASPEEPAEQPPGSVTSTRSGSPTAPSASPAADVGPTKLPIAGIHGIAVDSAGTVYAADTFAVRELEAGSSTPIDLPFTGQPRGVAVDTSGAVYVADGNNHTVWKLARGSATPEALPFSGLMCGNREVPVAALGVAVDDAGTVYLADAACQGRVVTLEAGASGGTVLPFTGLVNPEGIAVDDTGAVYVTDTGNNRVLKLEQGSERPSVVAFDGLAGPAGIAVNGSGDLYVGDMRNGRLLKLAAGSTTQSVVPTPDVARPKAVAVDSAGNLYLTDELNHTVVKLPAE